MRYTISIASVAELDIQQAKKHYKTELEGLELQFQMELEAKVEYLKRDAQSIQIRYDDIRICFLNRFPYGIHFQLSVNNVLIVGIYATKEDPEKWNK
jgi:toxin ParE1/3/4